MRRLIGMLFIFLTGGLCADMKDIHMKVGDDLDTVVKDVGDLRELGNLSERVYWDLAASSSLKSQEGNVYDAAMVNDGKAATAWVEAKGDGGIGEYIEFIFSRKQWEKYGPVSSHPSHKVGKILIVNGYAKTKQLWLANSRVKSLKVYRNKEFLFLLHLNDTRDIQSVYLDSMSAVKIKPDDRLRFEIAEVYPGTKHSDTAISEIVLGAH